MLGEEYPAFLESYEKEKYQALRLNSIKGDIAQMKDKVPFQLQPVAWAKDGFYYEKDDTPGKYPLHEAGVYYIQEPSAMAPVSYLMGDYDIKRLPSGASVDSDHEADSAQRCCILSGADLRSLRSTGWKEYTDRGKNE